MHEVQGSTPVLNKAECGTARLKFSQAHSLPQLHSKFKASFGLQETGVLE